MLHGIYSTSLRVIINKRHKVVVTSNRCRLDRSPNIHVNIVKNGVTNRGDEFHFDLLFDDTMFTKFQFAGLGTLEQTLLC